MAEENATCTFRMNEPFGRALKSVRTALAGAGLRVIGELDLSARIARTLLVNIPSCIVLFASASTQSTGEPASDYWDAAVAPLHVVVSARGSATEVHFLRALPRLNGAAGQPALVRLGQIQSLLSRAIEEIGMRSLDA